MGEPDRPRALAAYKLGQPVYPHAAAAYNSLCAVIQGFALGALAYQLNSHLGNNGSIPVEMWVRSAAAFLLITVIWHRYFTHAHFTAWMPRWSDSVILFAFAGVEYAFVYASTISAEAFSFSITFAPLVGILSYAHAWWTFKDRRIVQIVYREHFQDESATEILEATKRFNDFCLVQIAIVFAILWVSALAINLWPYSIDLIFGWQWSVKIEGRSLLSLYSVATICVLLFWFDIQWYFQKIKATQGFVEPKKAAAIEAADQGNTTMAHGEDRRPITPMAPAPHVAQTDAMMMHSEPAVASVKTTAA